jgi:hypothetical protein
MSAMSCFCGADDRDYRNAAISQSMFTREWDRRGASFDKLRMRASFCATKGLPHPELVEGRVMIVHAEHVE